MVAGAPRKVSPSPDECIKLGKECLEWVKGGGTKTDPRTTFAQFYSLVKMIPRKTWKSIIQTQEFLPYYESCQAILAKRCMDGTMEKSFGHRYIRLYDRNLVESENEEVEAKAKANKKEENLNPPKIVFEVNYSNDDNNKIEISPAILPTSRTEILK